MYITYFQVTSLLNHLLQVKRRTKKLSDLFQSYEPYGNKMGSRQTVLITEEAFDGKHLVGHNKYYEQVCLVLNN